MPSNIAHPMLVEVDIEDICVPLLYAGEDGNSVWIVAPPLGFADTLAVDQPETYRDTVERLRALSARGQSSSMRLQRCRVCLGNGKERPAHIIVVDQATLNFVEQQRLLAEERLHRARNILSIVNVIASQTLSSHLPEANLRAFLDRLQSLQTALSAACDETGDECEIVEIVARVIGRFCQPDDARVRCEGPGLTLSSRWSATLTLALHELATNAIKYGALSAKEGTVVLEWHKTGTSQRPLLCLTWRERGGPPVAQPSRRGFGSTLILSVFGKHPRCSAEMDFARTGLCCRICLPLPPAKTVSHI